MSYSWVPFYREVVQTVLTYEDNQEGLIEILREMKLAGLPTIPLEDNRKGGEPLREIDPFTFLANFGRIKDPQATNLCAWLHNKWNLTTTTPTNFDGRANVDPQNSWFFTSKEAGRKDGDIPLLWQLARQAFGAKISEIDPDLFSRCLKIRNIAIKKLTTGLFWLSPKGFLPLAGPVLPYLKEKGIEYDSKKLVQGNIEELRSLMEHAHTINFDNVALSHEAWEWGQNKPLTALETSDLSPDSPLNQILYGPPGTGKTFNSINHAVKIIDGLVSENRQEAKVRFEELCEKGQIEFVTFHQSFSYEEFIEGLRPVLDDNGEGEARYQIRDGILKALALQATGAALEKKNTGRATFEQLWNVFLEKIEDEDFVLQGLGTSRFKLSLSAAGNLTGSNIAGKADTRFNASRWKVEKVWEALRDAPTVNHASITQVLKVGAHTNLIGAVVEELKRIEKTLGRSDFPALQIVEKSSDAAKSFLHGSSDYRANFRNAPRFVLIIDEINRGNISKILGELITLLEDDKRLGRDNQLKVRLPISGDEFSLPPNLFLLGTMNTADKSLALLDTALRRRFSFEEMPPRAELFPDFARDVLKNLNLRIEAALDREHRIGHAYFIGCADEAAFNAVFRAKIIPLLQEFFYNDWETLRAVLGESGQHRFVHAMPTLAGIKSRTLWRWWFDTDDADDLNCLAALRANFGMGSSTPVVTADAAPEAGNDGIAIE